MPAMEYVKAKYRCTMRGEWYEVKVAALLYLRSKNSDEIKRFQLATNVEGAGALDDLVYRSLTVHDPNTWHTAFIQLKHKDKTTLKLGSFVGTSGDFSLKKYLKSFNEIRKAKQYEGFVNDTLFEGLFNDFRFVIYTNSKADVALMERKSSPDSFASKPAQRCELEALLQTNVDRELIFQFTREIDKKVFLLLEEVEETRAYVTDFLEKLTVFSGQPSESELDDIIKRELSIGCPGVVADCEAFYRIFEGLFKQWWRDSNMILDETSDILQRTIDQLGAEAQLMKQTEKYTLDVNFHERVWENFTTSFSDDVSLLIVVSNRTSLRLSATKVLRLLQAERLSSSLLGVEYLVQNQGASISDWRDGYKDCLVVVGDYLQYSNSGQFKSLCMDIVNVLQVNPNKKAIFVPDDRYSIVNYLEGRFDRKKYKVMDSKFNFIDLDESSMTKIFSKEVSFQDYKMKLSSLYDGGVNFWKSIISEHLVELVISNCIIEIGPRLPTAAQPYIPRKLKRNAVFNEEILQSEISSDAFGLLCVRGKELLQFVHENRDAISASDEKSSTKHSLLWARNRLTDWSTLQESHDVSHELAIMPLVQVKSDKLECVKSYKNNKKAKVLSDSCRGQIIDAESILDTDDDNILVLAEPGMGKSTLLVTLAQIAKRTNPSDWVVYINLRDHSQLFNQSEQLSAFDFIATVLRIELPWEREFLLESLERTGNIVVFLDSFDEICPRYIEEGGSLLTSILKKKVKKLVVTSRHSTKHLLEEHLSTLSYNLTEFTEDDQKMFLRKLWSNSSTSMTTSQIDVFVTKLIDSVSETDPERRLMGIPLQTMILAEVFQNHLMKEEPNDFFEKLNMLNILEQFVEKKFSIFFRKGNTFLDRDDSKKKFFDDHMLAALTLFVSDEYIQSFVTVRNIVENVNVFLRNIEEAKDNSGLIVSVVKQKPIFLHQLFAEYFAALWFSGNYLSNRQMIKDHLFLPNHNAVRNMFDRILARGHKLHEAVLDNDTTLVETMLSEKTIDVDTYDYGRRTALHLAAAMECHPSSPDDVHHSSNHRFIGPRPRHMIELLLDNGANTDVTDAVLQWTPIEYAFAINSWAAMDYLLASKADHKALVLTNWWIRNVDMMKIIFVNRYIHLFSMLIDRGLPVTFIPYKFRFTSIGGDIVGVQPFLHIASLYGNLEFVEHLMSRGADKYSRDADDSVPLHCASLCGHAHVVRALVESSSKVTIRTYFNTKYKFNWFRKYVNCTNSRGQSALHGAATSEVATTLISYGADIWIRDYQKRLGLHTASRFGRLSVVKAIVESLGKDKLSVRNLINTADKKGKSAMSLATRHGHSDLASFLDSHSQDV